jgi:ACS family hexuronate transporter-like MFS transporter
VTGSGAGVALVCLSALAFGITYSDHAPLIPLISADLRLDELRAGLLSTALFFAYLATTAVGVGFADRIGPKRAVGAGLVAATLGTALLAMAPAYAVALAGKALQGAGSAFAFISATRYIAALYGERRSHFALGLYGAGFPLGSGLALLLLPSVATLLGGWRQAIGTEAALLALATLAWTTAPAVAHVPARGDMRDAIRCPNCWAAFVQHAAGFGLAISAGTWITLYLLREFSLPLALSGVLGSLLLGVAVAARTGGGWLLVREHMTTKAVMRVGDATVVAGVVLLALPDRPLVVALLGSAFVGLGVGLPYSAVFNTAAASLRSAPAAAQGLAAVGGTFGVMVGAPVMGYAVQTYGFGAAWLFVGAVASLAFVVTFFMRGEEELR